MSADAARIIGEATTEALQAAAASLLYGESFPPNRFALAAAALALIIEGRESGALEWAVKELCEHPVTYIAEIDVLRALAGDRKE